MPGFCGGITLGDSRELDDLLRNGIDLEAYPILKYLIREDMEGLMQFTVSRGYKISDEGYYSKCHLCVDLRKYLNSFHEFSELKPDEFYANLG